MLRNLARKVFNRASASYIKPGSFWCEILYEHSNYSFSFEINHKMLNYVFYPIKNLAVNSAWLCSLLWCKLAFLKRLKIGLI